MSDTTVQLSLREQLAVHAPSTPEGWFKPVIPPEPKRDSKWEWCDGCKADADCTHTGDCDKLRAFNVALSDWKDLRDKQRVIQWPWAWADAVISARNAAKSPTQSQIKEVAVKPVEKMTAPITAKDAAALGYRITSRKHRMASRIDRPDWQEAMAATHPSGKQWVDGLGLRLAADYYRRVISRDTIVVPASWIGEVPNSNA